MKQIYRRLLLSIWGAGLSSLSWGQCFTTFGSYGVDNFPESVATGDFNGDGKLDLVTASARANTVTILLGDGTGGFSVPTIFNSGVLPTTGALKGGAKAVVVSDFNGDGKLDLATANGYASTVSLLIGNGNGTFNTAINFSIAGDAYSIAVGDFNGDGKPDLVMADPTTLQIHTLLNNGAGGFGSASSINRFNSYPFSVSVGDFNTDGKLDLVTSDSKADKVSVLLGNGNGSFGTASEVKLEAGSDPRSVAIGDFNGDGKPDLATANYTANTVAVLTNNGNGSFNAAVTLGYANKSYSIIAGDFNADSRLDLATANSGDNTVSVLQSSGLGFGYGTGALPLSVAIGDFNGDGKPDLVTANAASNAVSIFLNCFTPPTPNPSGLTLAAPAYDCTTGQLTLATNGGNGQLVEYRIAGLRDWSNSNSFTIPTYQRTGTTFTLEARQSGQVVSLAFATTCQTTTPTPPATPPTPPTPPVTPPTPPTGSGLSLAAPAYDCNTGQLQLSTTGGSGQLVEYRIAGLRDWAVSNTFTIPTYQRTGTSFTLEARQSGQVVSLAFTSACQTTTPTPPVTPPSPPVTPPTPPAGTPLTVSAQGLNCQTGVLQLVTTGGDGTAVAYKVPGLGDYTASGSFTVPTYQRSGTSFTLYARQSGREVTATYTATCPVGTRLASAEAAGSLEVVVYPNPVGEQFTVGVSGVTGQVVRFQLTNLSGQTVVEQQAQVESNQHTETLKLPASGAGLYLLKVSTNTQSKTVKVLKP